MGTQGSTYSLQPSWLPQGSCNYPPLVTTWDLLVLEEEDYASGFARHAGQVGTPKTNYRTAARCALHRLQVADLREKGEFHITPFPTYSK